jgi:4,5-DOPA dioxygenase extradiol
MNSITRQPALFLAHGSPMQAIEPGPYTAAWERIGATLPRPRAILVISAHWYVRGTAVTIAPRPKTIHDFYGFPPELYRVQYPAPGDPGLAARVQQLLAPVAVTGDTQWGLDHGAWSVLKYAYPHADVPVVQLAIDATLPPRAHYELGRALAPLRETGVLVLGSGNVVHNLRAMQLDAGDTAPQWAHDFNAAVRAALLAGDHEALIDYPRHGAAARMSVPTPEHYLPLLYVLGTQQPGEPVSLPVEGFQLGSIGMLSALLGGGA